MSGFHIENEMFDEVTAFWLSGPLSEANDLRPLTDGIEGMVLLLLDQVHLPSEEDATRFTSLVEGAHRPIYVARAPPRLIFSWTATVMPANARVVSVMVPFGCPRCGLKLERELQFEHFEIGPELSCPRDGAKMKLSLNVKKRKHLASMLIKPPLPVSDFLVANPFPPERKFARQHEISLYSVPNESGAGMLSRETDFASRDALGFESMSKGNTAESIQHPILLLGQNLIHSLSEKGSEFLFALSLLLLIGRLMLGIGEWLIQGSWVRHTACSVFELFCSNRTNLLGVNRLMDILGDVDAGLFGGAILLLTAIFVSAGTSIRS